MSPRSRRADGAGAALAALLLGLAAALPSAATPVGGLLISEVLFDPSGNDSRGEWIELVNTTGAAIDLSGYSLGWGRNSYTANTAALPARLLPPGATFVIGGPVSNGSNSSPSYDLVLDFNQNLGNGTSSTAADVLGLFFGNVAATPGLLPIHLLVYGRNRAATTVRNEQGTVAAVDLRTNGLPQGDSLAWQGALGWQIQATPTPNRSSVPEPAPGLLVCAGLGLLAAAGRRREWDG